MAHAIHPLADTYRDLSDAEYQALKDSISKHGQKHPIHVFQNQILDGRHRYKACRDLGIAPVFEEYTGEDLAGFVAGLNDARRHESAEDREMRIRVALDSVTTKRGGIGGVHKSNPPHGGLAKVTQKQAAKEHGTSERTIQRRAKEARDAESKASSSDLAKAYAATGEVPDIATIIRDNPVAARTARDIKSKTEVMLEASGGNAVAPVSQSEIDRMVEVLANQKIEQMREEIYNSFIDGIKEKIMFADHYLPSIYRKNIPLTQAEYTKILFCLHPDVIARFGDDDLTSRFAEAFQVFKEKKTQLMLPDMFKATPAPPTYSEYVAQKVAEAKAKAAAKKTRTTAKKAETHENHP